jgi:hypothetical protein
MTLPASPFQDDYASTLSSTNHQSWNERETSIAEEETFVYSSWLYGYFS